MGSIVTFLPSNGYAVFDRGDAWYLVQCKPREDRRAVDNLRNQGFASFAPTCVVERLRNRCWKKRVEALFPGYAFVHLNRIDHDWGKIRSTRGVSRLVRFGEQVPVVPEIVIARIRALDGVQIGAPLAQLAPGAAVRILDGPFADVEGIFECKVGAERVMLLLQFMHRQVRMQFDSAAIMPA